MVTILLYFILTGANDNEISIQPNSIRDQGCNRRMTVEYGSIPEIGR